MFNRLYCCYGSLLCHKDYHYWFTNGWAFTWYQYCSITCWAVRIEFIRQSLAVRRVLETVASLLKLQKWIEGTVRKVLACNEHDQEYVSPFISLQDSRSVAGTEDKETFLVTLTKPCLYVQQVAFDKGEHPKWSHSHTDTNIKEFIFSWPKYCEMFNNYSPKWR